MPKKVRKKINTALIFILVLLICSFLFFIVNISSKYHDKDVLLQINKFFPITQTQDSTAIYLKPQENFENALSKVYQIIAENNGVIQHYNLKREKNSIELILSIKEIKEDRSVWTLIIHKDYNENENRAPFTAESDKKNKICLIIDDAGYALGPVKEYLALPIALGIAVLPYLEKSYETAQLVHENNKEVLLHMPMEPKDQVARKIKLYQDEIMSTMNKEQVDRAIDQMLDNVHYAKGVNNHQGSKATENRNIMYFVLEKLKAEHLFFIDSVTSEKSVVQNIANEVDIDFGKRDIFLDNVNEYSYVKGQMEKLLNIATKRGRAIGIGHMNRKNTFQVIKDYVPIFQTRDIQVVFPSVMIKEYRYKEVTKNVKENIISGY